MIPGPRARRVRPLRHGAPQHLHQRADGAARDVADAGARRPVLRRADFRRRGLRRVGRVRADRRPQRRGAGARRGAARAAADDGDRRAGVLRVARRPAQLPADQHHVRHHGRRPRRAPARPQASKADRKQATSRARARRRSTTGWPTDRRQLRSELAARVPRLPPPESQRVRPHRRRLRQRPLAVPRVRRRRTSDKDAASAASPATSSSRPIRAFMAELYRQGQSRASVGAQAVGAAHVRALPAARRMDRGRSRGAGRGAEARAEGAGAPLGGRDVAAARGARHDASRSAAATARSSSCSTRRACA